MAKPKQVKEKATISEINFRELFDMAIDCMLILGSDGYIKEINRVGYEQLGYKKAEMVGSHLSKFISPEFASILGDRIAKLQDQGFLVYESEQVRKDGTKLPVEISSRTIQLDGGTAFFSVVREITGRKLAEQALQKSERDLKQAQAIAHFGSWTHDMAGHITWSDELYRIFGVSPENIALNTETFYTLIHPDDRYAMQAWTDVCISGQPPGPIVWRSIRPDGTIRYILGEGELILDDEGRISHMAGTVQDITERLQAEMDLHELNADLVATLQAIPDLLFELDQNGVYIDAWARNPELLLVQKETFIGHTVSEILPAEAASTVMSALREAGENGYSHGQIIQLDLPNGKFWFELSTSVKEKTNVSAKRYMMLSRDITDRVEAMLALQNSEAWFRSVFENVNTGVASTDSSGRVTNFNETFRAMLGYDAEELSRMNFADFTHPEDLELEVVIFDEILAGKRNSYHMTKRYLTGDGRIIWVDLSAAVIRNADGKVENFVAVVQDITDRKQAEEELRISATAFESQESLMITDSNGVIMRVNKAFTESTGYTAEEVVGQTPRLLKSGRHNADFYREMWETLLRTGKWQGEIWDRRKNGEVYPKWLAITAVKDSDGNITHFVGSHIDITERKAAEEEIQYLAFYDSLTRLPNRRLLLDRLNQALVSSARSGRAGALLFIDLDNFKNLNDTLGHDIGDMLLQQVTQRLESCIRVGDTVARLGGDEFVVMLLNMSTDALEAAAQTETIGEKILATLGQPYQLAAHVYHCTASVGVTLLDNNQQSTDELMKQADIAMYQAKKAGRNALRFFDRQMQESISARVSMENELHNALEFEQFHLYYQIQVDSSYRPLGAEALIRWIHPQRGLVPPAQFIPLAEESGLILPVGLWVLETACARIKAWEQGALTRDLVLAVNVSAKQFRQADFVAQVQAFVQRHAINPMRLKLELTEGMLLENIEETITIMNALNEIGVQFSLDDFGTGYSSLQYLKRLPLDQLKIDQSFVRDIAANASDIAIVRTIVAIARSMEMEVIAEGVETEQQRQLLLNNGCSSFQGYLFGRPVPIEQFEAMIKQG
jgi:diguanylate cyclase (GGDEF)-like protein/PAS domain S-box-containing protein